MSAHIRNTGPMLASRVVAQNRCGGACRSPAVNGRQRCACTAAHRDRAPKGKPERAQARLFTRDAIAERRRIQALLGEARKLLQEMK